MAEVIEFDTAHRLRMQFRMSIAAEDAVVLTIETLKVAVTTTGQALYSLYNSECSKNGLEAFGWGGLAPAQQFVWQRMADALGLSL
jgi:hypothetical protein